MNKKLIKVSLSKINKSNNSIKNIADILFPEDADLEDVAVIDIPPEQRRLHTETFDFSIATIFSYLNEGNIYIPKFQRKYVWTRSQASRLIESLIIQCPIPVIYLNQDKDEKLSVIDGNQRLTSIKLFIEDKFPLQGLTAYPELEGFKFSDLDTRIKRHIKNRTLRCITILKETHPQIKFDVFERINTGAVHLNPQEVRHGIYHGALIDTIDDLAKEKIWKDITGYKNDNRMKSEELILRYISLIIWQDKYKKPLKKFLNDFCSEYQNANSSTILNFKNEFLNALEISSHLFGKKAFKMLDENMDVVSSTINTALFDAVMVGITKSNLKMADIKGVDMKKFMREYQRLITSRSFSEYILSGTSATSFVNNRINNFSLFLTNFFNI